MDTTPSPPAAVPWLEHAWGGIAVAKAWLDVAVRPERPTATAWRTENSDTAIAHLVERIRALAPQLLMLEASGGYERLVGD